MGPSVIVSWQPPAERRSLLKVAQAVLVGNLWAYTGVVFYAFLVLATRPYQPTWKFPRPFIPAFLGGIVSPPWLVWDFWRQRREDGREDGRQDGRQDGQDGQDRIMRARRNRVRRERRRRELNLGGSERQEPQRQEPEQYELGQVEFAEVDSIPNDPDSHFWGKVVRYIQDNNKFDITSDLPEAARAA